MQLIYKIMDLVIAASPDKKKLLENEDVVVDISFKAETWVIFI